MNLKHLNNLDLDARVKSLWQQERSILHELLLALKEVESRRSYLERGFSSLFDYLVREIGCDGGTAQRRIDAVRLMMDVPSASGKIQSGELSLNKISLIQQACREVKKLRNIKVAAKEKAELMEVVLDKDPKTCQKEIAQYFDIPVVQPTVQKVQADESVRVELTLSKDLYEKIQEAQALLSHALSGNDLVSYLSYVTDKVIKQKTSVRALKSDFGKLQSQKGFASEERFPNGGKNREAPKYDLKNLKPGKEAFKSTSARKSVPTSHFSARSKKIVIAKDKCCQFRDPITKRQCGSKWFLQVDHIQPVWAEGNSAAENAQILCAAHNKMKYFAEAGISRIS